MNDFKQDCFRNSGITGNNEGCMFKNTYLIVLTACHSFLLIDSYPQPLHT